MSTLPFMLNARFTVEPNLNLVNDSEQGKEFRLEPRLMKLLCLLAQKKDELLTRETIIKEIWDNYGNPDESLTQAISYLRKVLSDQQKKVIETVPKKGYVFRATVTELVPESTIFLETRKLPKQKFRRYPVAIFLLATAVAVMVFFFLRSGKNQNIGNPDIKQLNEVSSRKQSPAANTTTEIPFPGLSREEDNNDLNTITTTDSLGTRYRLVMIGDRRPEFYVNDSLQSNQEPYDGLIDRLAKELWKRQKEVEKLHPKPDQ
jgi:DNA-binding winged helix-turn-helix (wHTH) protein